MKRFNRSSFAYEVKNMQGDILLPGISSYIGKTVPITIQEAMLEAPIKGRDLGYNNFVFLSDSKRVVQVTNKKWIPNWQERSLLTDWSHLAHNDTNYHSPYFPRSVISNVSNLAKLATRTPIHCYMVNQTLL